MVTALTKRRGGLHALARVPHLAAADTPTRMREYIVVVAATVCKLAFDSVTKWRSGTAASFALCSSPSPLTFSPSLFFPRRDPPSPLSLSLSFSFSVSFSLGLFLGRYYTRSTRCRRAFSSSSSSPSPSRHESNGIRP